MPKEKGTGTVSREQLIRLLNEDLAREDQAIIAYVVYSQVLKGREYMNIAKELEVHAKEELQHALTIAKQIDYLGGMPTVSPCRSRRRRRPRTCCASIWTTRTRRCANYRDAGPAVRGAWRVRDGRADSRDPGAGAGAPDRPGDGARCPGA